VALPAPKKLVNPFAARQQGAASIPPPVSPAGAPKKLTWSERQALAKKQSEADEQSSKGASLRAGVGIGAALGVGAAALAVVASQAEDAPEPSLEPEEPAYEPPPPPPPPPPPAPPAPPVVDKEDDIELAEQVLYTSSKIRNFLNLCLTLVDSNCSSHQSARTGFWRPRCCNIRLPGEEAYA
jgi:hypothetical protein